VRYLLQCVAVLCFIQGEVYVAMCSCIVLYTGYGIRCSVYLYCALYKVRYMLHCVAVLCFIQGAVYVAVCSCIVLYTG
jgi:hypothetical protein